MTSAVTYEEYEAATRMGAGLQSGPGYSRFDFQDAWTDVLKVLCSGSAGFVMPALDYGSILPHIGSSSFIFDCRFTQASSPSLSSQAVSGEFQRLLSLPVMEQMQELQAALALNKSQLAQVLRVTRPTVYDWLRGKEPNEANADRLLAMLQILVRASVTGAAPLNARFVRQPMGLDEPSLLELLSEEQLEEEQIVDAISQAQSRADVASRRRTTREERLRSLGFEEPALGERREWLARSVATKDWPRR